MNKREIDNDNNNNVDQNQMLVCNKKKIKTVNGNDNDKLDITADNNELDIVSNFLNINKVPDQTVLEWFKKLNELRVLNGLSDEDRVHLFKTCMDLFLNGVHQLVQEHLIPFTANLFHENIDRINEFKVLMEQLLLAYRPLRNYDIKLAIMKLLTLIFKNHKEHLQKIDLDDFLFYLDALEYLEEDITQAIRPILELSYHCNYDYIEVLEAYLLSEYYSEDVIMTLLDEFFNTTKSDDEMIWFIGVFNSFVSHIDNDGTNPYIKYLSIMLQWVDDHNYDSNEKEWIETPDIFAEKSILSVKEGAAGHALTIMASKNPDLLLKEFIRIWNSAFESKQGKDLFVVANILTFSHKYIHSIVNIYVYYDIIQLIKNNAITTFVKLRYMFLLISILNEGGPIDINVQNDILKCLLDCKNPDPCIIPPLLSTISFIINERESKVFPPFYIKQVFEYIRPYMDLSQSSKIIQSCLLISTKILDIEGEEGFEPYKEESLRFAMDNLEKFNSDCEDGVKCRTLDSVSTYVSKLTKDDRLDRCATKLIEVMQKNEPKNLSEKYNGYYMHAIFRIFSTLNDRFDPFIDFGFAHLLRVAASIHYQTEVKTEKNSDLVTNVKTAVIKFHQLAAAIPIHFQRYVGDVITALLKMLDCLVSKLKQQASLSIKIVFAVYKLSLILNNINKDTALKSSTHLYNILKKRIKLSLDIENNYVDFTFKEDLLRTIFNIHSFETKEQLEEFIEPLT